MNYSFVTRRETRVPRNVDRVSAMTTELFAVNLEDPPWAGSLFHELSASGRLELIGAPRLCIELADAETSSPIIDIESETLGFYLTDS